MKQKGPLFLFLIVLLSLCPTVALTQRAQMNSPFSEAMYVVSNYSSKNNKLEKEVMSIDRLLNNGVRAYIFELKLDSTQILARIPADTLIDAYELLKPIAEEINSDPDELFVCFLDYSFSTEHIISLLKKLDLFHKLWIEDRPGLWPGPKEITKSGKQLIIFTMQSTRHAYPGFYYLWDHAVEPFPASDFLPEYTGEYKNGSSKNPLLFFRGYNLPEDTVGLDFPFKDFYVNENPFLVGNLINLWKQTGKKPNFLVVNRYTNQAMGIRNNVLAHRYVRGMISHNAGPLSNIHWEGSVDANTSGYFSFPFIPGEEVDLKLNKPGYTLKPSRIEIDEIENNIIQNIIAQPISIHSGLQAYYPFEESLKDFSLNNRHGKNGGSGFHKDPERGNVLILADSQYVELPNAMELELYNHDFTVSAWVKIDSFLKRDFTVLGTRDSYYRKGLHLQFRQERPYFGFYSNDMMGNEILDAERWYHIVWRYTKSSGEQAIFIDGLPDSRSIGHPSFMGRSNLIIGKSIHQNNFFEGIIDDLAIWNRPLGNEEIWNLYQDVYDLSEIGFLDRLKVQWKYYVGVAFIFSMLIVVLIFLRRGKPAKKLNLAINGSPALKANSISFFGGFQVMDSNNDDISQLFTSRVKLLFILILLHSYKSKKGISSDAIDQIIWPEYDRKSAANNRRVTMNKLRQILQRLDGVELSNEADVWLISLNEKVYFDYGQCVSMIRTGDFSKDPEQFSGFYSSIYRGSLLPEIEDDWLDRFKGEIASEIIDTIIHFIQNSWNSCPSDLIVKLCDRIFDADPLNEEALSIKIKVLRKMGLSNKANFTLQEFSKLYEDSMGEKYEFVSQ